ncbi:MAG TPA: LLM class flavin-dependent oxidoreductase [Actinomycetota bacterium]|nr:LLM class flavin-dependent oxidoreductase [Actinomycetota bacterium]
MSRAFGIPATGDEERAGEIAAAVEQMGYSTIWSNDTPAADGLATAAAMADATESIRLGVGVVAVDRRPPEDIVQAVRDLELPFDRLVLGVGAGSSAAPLIIVRRAVEELREMLGPEPRIAVAAMGRMMCLLAGEIADTVLLNWMIPARIEWAKEHIARGIRRSDRDEGPEVAAYVRTAIGPGARDRIAKEAARYNSYPAYTRHFDAMGVPLRSVGVTDERGGYPTGLADYDRVLDEVVVRALPASDTVESTLAVAEASAPVGRI